MVRIILLCAFLLLPLAVRGQEMPANVFDYFLVGRFLNEHEVNFENLQYTGTQVVFVFWGLHNAGPRDKAPLSEMGAAEWLKGVTDKYAGANVAVVGVFAKDHSWKSTRDEDEIWDRADYFSTGLYDRARTVIRTIGDFPQVDGVDGVLMRRVCGIKEDQAAAIVAPNGRLTGTLDKIDFHSGQFDVGIKLEQTPSEGEAIALPFQGLLTPPATLEGIADLLRRGHMAPAYRKAAPYRNSRNPAEQQAAGLAMNLIEDYQKNVLKEIRELIAKEQIGDAYVIASRIVEEWSGIDCEFADECKAIIKTYKKTPAIKELNDAYRHFATALKSLNAVQSRRENERAYAKKYLETIIEKYPDSYYARKARELVKFIARWQTAPDK